MAGANPYATVFQTKEWFRAWISAVSEADLVEPLILRVPASGVALGAIALQADRRTDAHGVLTPLSSPWADYHEAVGNPSDTCVVDSLSAALLDFARSHNLSVLMDDVRPGGMLAGILDRLPCSRGLASATEAIALQDDQHWKEIQDKREHEMKWRRLNRLGKVRCEHHTNFEIVMRKMTAFIEMHRRQWAGRPDAVAPFDGGVVDHAFREMTRHLAPRRMMILTELSLDSRPLAMYFGFLYGGSYLAYRTTFDQAHRRLSPGHLMLRRMIADFRSAGLRELDLMRGAYPYKRSYSNRLSRNLRYELRNCATLQ